MTNLFGRAGLSVILLLSLMALGVHSLFAAAAAFNVVIKNETGYTLQELKYVLEKGETNTLIEQAKDVSNGSSCTFSLKEGGIYRVYTSILSDGKTVYAKGSAHNLRPGGSYRLTLQKIVVSQSGAGMNYIGKGEFEAIK